ncbi:DNA-packaging protein FI [Klebsiella sp. BIGb0407]|uniref:DNA-packaging protein FI n=1 Tax=Klebsiella sp. BIGb0407 TaxID=2940603 RepID=UPI002167932A|nr:DNA-packaging protein FI [Klebsiella sp. BIGb0407]MCS3433698.1 hypothetical protein [Klebsiella sp. BIGb0407]
MNKDELVTRLTELGKKLNREVILTGSKEDLTLRVAELEEELGDEDDGDEGAGILLMKPAGGVQDQQVSEKTTQGLTADELVLVETLVTLHIEALHETRNEKLMIVEPGVAIRILQQEATSLINLGLAREH